MHRAGDRWEDATYNPRTHKSLRTDLTGPLNDQPGRQWKEQTSVMAAGLTKQVVD
jgi:hypothetical protein